MSKDSFVLVREQRPAFDCLSDEDAGKLIKAVLAYQFDGAEPELPPVPQMAFAMMRPVFERFAARYAETCRKRKEAGAKGGKAKKANASDAKQTKQMLANASDAKQSLHDRDRDRDREKKETKISVNTHTEKKLEAQGVCVNPPVYSQEDVEEAKQDVRREASAIRQEFDRLRDAYKAVRDDGPNAGWAEYQQARFSKGWPGLLIVLDRLQTLIEQDEQWQRGYKEGLRRFLADRMWEMEPRKAAPQQPVAPAAQRGRPQAGMTWADVRTEKNKQACQNGLRKYLEEQGIAMEEELEQQPYVEWTATVEE